MYYLKQILNKNTFQKDFQFFKTCYIVLLFNLDTCINTTCYMVLLFNLDTCINTMISYHKPFNR